MRKSRRSDRKKTRAWLFPLAVLCVFATTAAASYWYLKPKFEFKSPFLKDIESRRLHGTRTDTAAAEDPRLYASSVKVPTRDIRLQSRELSLAEAEDVIREYMSAHDTRLLDLYMDADNTIYADLSDDLRKRFSGDVSDELHIISGLYKSLRARIPHLNSLKILIEGKEAESFGGHIDISRPIEESVENIHAGNTSRRF